jgi:uncharacterized membrane protein
MTPQGSDDRVSLDLVPSLSDAVANASLGPVPGWMIMIGVGFVLR